MLNLLKPVTDKIGQMITTLIINGLILVVLAALITWNVIILQLLIGLVVLVVAFSFFYTARKLYIIKKLLSKN